MDDVTVARLRRELDALKRRVSILEQADTATEPDPEPLLDEVALGATASTEGDRP